MENLNLEYNESEFLGDISKEDEVKIDNSKENIEKLFIQEEVVEDTELGIDGFTYDYDLDLVDDVFSFDEISTLDEIFSDKQ